MRDVSDHIEISEAEKPLVFADGATTIAYGMRGLNWRGRIRYRYIIWKAHRKVQKFYQNAISRKECYYGPFKGEFGHLLLHNLPFLMHLHSKGVAIHFCGMELHKPFLVDQNGDSIIQSWYPLRDFFAEVPPRANETIPPADVQQAIDNFRKVAIASGVPFLDISDNDMYWYVFRNWQLEGRQHQYPLGPVYAQRKTNSCVIFPRKKGASLSPNNGGPWNYMEIARAVAPYFDKVYLVGHPSLSAEAYPEGNIELKISSDNTETLKYCAEGLLIITQHSGAVHLGAWLNVPVLVIFNGAPPIKGLIDTLRFRRNIANRPLNYAFSLPEIVKFVATLTLR